MCFQNFHVHLCFDIRQVVCVILQQIHPPPPTACFLVDRLIGQGTHSISAPGTKGGTDDGGGKSSLTDPDSDVGIPVLHPSRRSRSLRRRFVSFPWKDPLGSLDEFRWKGCRTEPLLEWRPPPMEVKTRHPSKVFRRVTH